MNRYDPFNILKTKEKSIGKPPGTLVYSGSFPDVVIRIEIICYDSEKINNYLLNETGELKKLLQEASNSKQKYWINIIGLHSPDLIRLIGQQLNIHSMDLEDIIHMSQWSKMEIYREYLFSVFKMIYLKEERIIHEHLSMIRRGNILITFQETAGDVFGYVRERLQDPKGKLRISDSAYLYYTLLDAIIDEYLVVINQISINFNNIELQILEESDPSKEEIYRLRKELLYLSNSITPLTDSLRKFMARENPYFDRDLAPYYQDLYENLNQMINGIRGYREMSNGLHEMQMSNAGMKMNQTMMTLTIFSVIFIPLTFLTGVFGMNFLFMPGLNEPSAFTIFVITCLGVAAAMLGYFKLRRW